MTSLELNLSPFLDQLVERIVDEVTERLAERLFGPAEPPPGATVLDEEKLAAALSSELAAMAEAEPEPELEPAPVVAEPAAAPERKKRAEGEQRTCEICGRKGTRRYVQTPTGWKCSPTATACAPQFKPPGKYTRPAASDIPAKEFQPNVTPSPEPVVDLDLATGMREHGEALHRQMASEPAPRASGVTARCQDCTRTWILTGRILEIAAEAHELKHAHIVDVFDEVASA